MLYRARSRPVAAEIAHGAIDYRELAAAGLSPDEVVDFSANINPFGPSPPVLKALADARIDRYPDRDAIALRAAFARRLGLPVENILAGNGVSELIWLIGMAFLQAGDEALIVGPTYGEYARAAALADGIPRIYSAESSNGFRPCPSTIEKTLADVRPRLVFICHPNNPTGVLAPLAPLAAWAQAHRHTLFVVDEAYLEFADTTSALSLGVENVLTLRSMTKAYSLAGLRLGFAIGAPAVLEALARVRPPWSVNAMAQAAGIAALEDHGHLRASLTKITAAKQQLLVDLKAAGYLPLESATSFFLIPVGDGGRVRAALLRRGLLVRDCASFGLPEYIRVSVQRIEQNARLVAALGELR